MKKKKYFAHWAQPLNRNFLRKASKKVNLLRLNMSNFSLKMLKKI